MSILNVDKIQPIGGGSTITVDATDIQATSATITASKFVGSGDLSVTGVSTFTGNIDANGDLDVAGNIDANGDLDVDGHTNLDNVSISGITTSNQINISSSGPRLTFSDSNENPDFYIEVNASQFLIQDATANAQRFRIQSNGVVDIAGNVNCDSGIDVVGTITGNNLTLSDNDPELTFTDLNNNPDYRIKAESGNLSFEDTTNGNVARLRINADGHVDVTGNLDVGAGIDVTGNANVTGDLSIAQNLVHTGDTDTKLHFETNSIKFDTAGTQKMRIYDDGVVAIGQSSKSSTVGAGGLDIQGNGTNCIIEMGNPFPGFSGGVTPEFRITATNSSHEVKFETIWGGDNALHPHLAFTGGRTHFYRGTNSDEIARFDSADFGIGTTSPDDRLHVNGGDIIISTANAPNLRVVKADDSSGSNSTRAFFGIATGSNNYMNGSADPDLCIVGPDGGKMLFGFGNSVKLFMESNGRLKSAATYNNTTGSSANVSMPNNTGEFFRSTSSRKYKDNITTLTDALADKILDCRPVSYTSTCAADDNSKIFYGMIAEEVHDVDTSLVLYDNESETPEPEGVQYDRFVPALVNLVKRQKAQIATLEAKVAALEGS